MITRMPGPLSIASLGDDLVWYDVDLSDFDNLRHSPRVPVFSRVETLDMLGGVLRARDIGLGGMRVLSRDGRIAHRAGEPVPLRFALPTGERPLFATATVVAQRDAGNDLAVGLRFERLTTQTALAIYRLVQQRNALAA
jgi:hypothetical protein